ncbi:MAG: hypothetical protein ACKV2T_20535 [Kofleriaceae bacterium]
MSQHLVPRSELQLRPPQIAAPSAPAPSAPIQMLSPSQYTDILGPPDPMACLRAQEWMIDGPVPPAPRLRMPELEDGFEPNVTMGDFRLQLRPHVEGVNEPDRFDPSKAAAEQREKTGRPRNEK